MMEWTNTEVFYYGSLKDKFVADLKEKAKAGLISNYQVLNDSDRSSEKYIVNYR